MRVTKTKARNLLYQAALRRDNDNEDIEEELRAILRNPRIVRNGDVFLVEVPQPLAMDRLRRRVRHLGFLSDGSFSGAIARVPETALVALVQDLVPEDEQQQIRHELQRQGLPVKSFRGILQGVLQAAGKKVAGGAGEALGGSIGDALGMFFEKNTLALTELLSCVDEAASS